MVKISVIIPTRNRAKYLQTTLNSIVEQNLDKDLFEVIVVDNGSNDNTSSVLELFKERICNFRSLYCDLPGLHVGRHIGLKEAAAELLVFADDDIEAFPTWLSSIVDSFKDPTVAMVGGKILPKYEEKPPDFIIEMWNKDFNGGHLIGYLSVLDFGDEIKEIDPHFIFGCNFAIRKSILLEAGGFHPDGMPQELIRYRGDGETYISDYVLRNKFKAIYNPKASVYHKVTKERLTFNYFLRRSFNQGISDSYTNVRIAYGKRSNLIGNLIKKSLSIIYHFLTQRNGLSDQLQYAANKGYFYHHYQCLIDKNLCNYVLRGNYLENYGFK